MNYYKRHLGDYARDTGHLTALEHGIYTLLLDWYYINERPIPKDKAKRIAKGNPIATQTVLSEFFLATENGWAHRYADRIIDEFHVKSDHNREAGKLGGRPKKTQTVSKPNPEITLATSHKPLATKDQEQKPLGVPRGDALAAAVLGAYHSALPKCKAISVLNPKRRKRLADADKLARQVCVEQGWEYEPVGFWGSYFSECSNDPWMRGEVANPKNPRWRQNLDVLLAEDRFAGIMDTAIAAMRAAA